MAEDSVVETAKQYYDSSDADNFYHSIWGGEDIHIGMYESDSESISDASHRTVDKMLERLDGRPETSRVLDLGAGYGGSARHITRAKNWQVTCLNLSSVQNERNRDKNREQGLEPKIDVFDGNFEELPFADESYDIVWSQDSFLHSGKRLQIFREVDRVLRCGGDFVFTDPMQDSDASREELAPVLARLHLDSMGSFELYAEYARQLGWEILEQTDLTDCLVNHYTRVRSELDSRAGAADIEISPEYISRMKEGLGHWIEAGEARKIRWGIHHFRKPERSL